MLSGIAPHLTYTPRADYFGEDSFSFKVSDEQNDSKVVNVDIMVTPINDTPIANSRNIIISKNTLEVITLVGSDVDNSDLTYSILINPSHGSLRGTAPNLVYTPDVNYIGSDNFTFRVDDGRVNSTATEVTIAVVDEEKEDINISGVITYDYIPKNLYKQGLDYKTLCLLGQNLY